MDAEGTRATRGTGRRNAFGGQRSIQLSYGCVRAPLSARGRSAARGRGRRRLRGAPLAPSRRSFRHGLTRFRWTSPSASALRRGDAVVRAASAGLGRAGGPAVGDCRPPTCQPPVPGRSRRTDPRSARGRPGRAGARPRSPNPRARRSGEPRRLSGSRLPNSANLRTVRVGIERPEGRLQHFHRQRAERLRRRLANGATCLQQRLRDSSG